MDRPNISSRRNRRITAIGDLNTRIQIQDRTLQSKFQTGLDDALIFETVLTCWAKIETKSGKLFFDGVGMIKGGYTDFFTIRYRSDVDNRFKWVLYDGNRYKIGSIENLDHRKEFMVLYCTVSGSDDFDNQASGAL